MRLSRPRLPRWAPALVGVLVLAAAGLPAMLLGWSLIGWLALAWVLFLVALPAWSLGGGEPARGRRPADDLPDLVRLRRRGAPAGLADLDRGRQGLPVVNGEFLTYSMRNIVGAGGGIFHALVGTLLVTLAAAVISVPVGIFAAIYLVEYGPGRAPGAGSPSWST